MSERQMIRYEGVQLKAENLFFLDGDYNTQVVNTAYSFLTQASRSCPGTPIGAGVLIAYFSRQAGIESPRALGSALLNDPSKISRAAIAARLVHEKYGINVEVNEDNMRGFASDAFAFAEKVMALPDEVLLDLATRKHAEMDQYNPGKMRDIRFSSEIFADYKEILFPGYEQMDKSTQNDVYDGFMKLV